MKPASVVLVVLLSTAMASVSAAQSNGVPASVTSFGFGGSRNMAPGVPASVTSLGPRGFGPTSQCCATRFFPPGTIHVQPGNLDFHHHHRGSGNGFNNYGIYPGYIPIYSYGGYDPGYSPVIVAQQEDSVTTDEDAEEGGPTVFEHRGSRRAPAEEAYSRGYEEGRAAAEDARHDRRHADARPGGEERGARKSDEHSEKTDAKSDDQPAPAVVVKTVLVYKDSHKEEIANYAIVGDQLFDFTNGRRKIAISDLDVTATTKANDERGVDFQLPAVRAKR
jgi:hypothetical protein